MYGQWAIKCTAVSVWSNTAVTSSRSPKGSQKVTALPCISTPHCSPTSQLLHSDLRGEESRMSYNNSKRCHGRDVVISPCDYKRSREPFHLPDARVQLSLEVGVEVVTQHSVLAVEFHCKSTCTICSQLDTICTTPCLLLL